MHTWRTYQRAWGSHDGGTNLTITCTCFWFDWSGKEKLTPNWASENWFNRTRKRFHESSIKDMFGHASEFMAFFEQSTQMRTSCFLPLFRVAVFSSLLAVVHGSFSNSNIHGEGLFTLFCMPWTCTCLWSYSIDKLIMSLLAVGCLCTSGVLSCIREISICQSAALKFEQLRQWVCVFRLTFPGKVYEFFFLKYKHNYFRKIILIVNKMKINN